nr:immunoglobulin heavy chain junction region [Macaca mulatta]
SVRDHRGSGLDYW